MAVGKEPFRCPECGGTAWKANYYEAVWQTITLFDVGGEPVMGDYMGVTGTYDDPSTDDEAYVCRECGHEIELGRLLLVEPFAAAVADTFLTGLRAACGYDPEAEGSVDDLIGYKDALEDALSQIVTDRGLPPSVATGGPQGGS